MLLLAQTSLIAYYGIRFHVYLFSQASLCLAWWFQQDCVEERAHLGLVVGAWPGAAVWSPSPLSPDSIVGLLYSSHNAVLVCVWESLALISSKLQSSWTYNGDQRMGKKSCYSFPLESIHCQAWTSNSGARTNRGWERLGDGFSTPYSLLCATRSLCYRKHRGSIPPNVFYGLGWRLLLMRLEEGRSVEGWRLGGNPRTTGKRAEALKMIYPPQRARLHS